MAPRKNTKSVAPSDKEVLAAPPCSFKLPLQDFPPLGNGINFGSFDPSDTDGMSTAGVSTTDSARDAEVETPKLRSRSGKQRKQSGSAPLPGHLQDQGFQPVIDLGVDEVTRMASEEVARFSARLKDMSTEILHCDSSYERNRCINRAMADYATAMKWVQTISPQEEVGGSGSNAAAGVGCKPEFTEPSSAPAPSSCRSSVAGGDAIGASILAMVQTPKHSFVGPLATQPPPPMSPMPTNSMPVCRLPQDMLPPPPNSPPRFRADVAIDGPGSSPYHQHGPSSASCVASPSMQGPPPGAFMQNGQFPPQQSMPLLPNMFGMQNDQTMQAMPQQQQVLQTVPPRSQWQHHSAPVMQQPSHSGQMPQGLQQPQPQHCMQGMPSQQHLQCNGPQNMQGMAQGRMHEAPQCLQTSPGSQSPHGFQNSQGMQNVPAMHGAFGENTMASCGYQLMVLPAGVAPPEGAIPAGPLNAANLPPQAHMQLNSQWEEPHKSSNPWRIIDPHTGEELGSEPAQSNFPMDFNQPYMQSGRTR